jgi:tetratricopeptide (TPR) repeat protein
LGSGSFSQCYLAADMSLGWRPVVLKLSSGFAAEAEALARLEHENIVPVLSAIPAEAPERAGLCMPYLGRATLQHVINHLRGAGRTPRRARTLLEAIDAINRTGWTEASPDVPSDAPSAAACVSEEIDLPCPPPDPRLVAGSYVDGVVHVGAQLASALAAAHAKGICHFDIKPSNILMAPGGIPMLFDFNLASNQGRAAGGTPRYMAPEQVRAVLCRDAEAQLGPAADVYSLGVVLYELLTGRHPLGEGPHDAPATPALEALLRRHGHDPIPIGVWNREVDARVARLVHRALAVDPAQRPTAAELAASLRSALSAGARSVRWLQRHRLLAAACALGGLLLLAAAGAVSKSLPGPAERAYQRGVACLREGDAAAAVDALKDCVHKDSRNAVAWFLLARAHERLGNWDLALKAYEEACARADDAWLDACMGTAVLRNNGSPIRAGVRLRDALRKGLRTAGLYNNLGLVCRKRSQLEEAMRWFNLAIERQPSLQPAYFNRAALAYSMALREKTALPAMAVADIEMAIALGPPSVELYTRAAVMHLAAQPKGDPPSPLAVERLGDALRHSKHPKLPYFSFRVVALQPSLPADLVGSAEPWPERVQAAADPLPPLSVEELARKLAQRLAKR